MKIRKISRYIAPMCMAAVLAGALLAGCGDAAAITIQDGNQVYVVTGAAGKTVGEILSELGITLSEDDSISVDPETLVENNAEITISRTCTVKVIIDGKEQEVTLNGARVRDVLESCKLKLENGDIINFSDDEYLTDGMVIMINTKETAKEANQPKDIIFAGDMDGWIDPEPVTELESIEETTEAVWVEPVYDNSSWYSYEDSYDYYEPEPEPVAAPEPQTAAPTPAPEPQTAAPAR